MLKAIGVWKLGSAVAASALGLVLVVGGGTDPVEVGSVGIQVEPPRVSPAHPPWAIRLVPPSLESTWLEPPWLRGETVGRAAVGPAAVDLAAVDLAGAYPAATRGSEASLGMPWVRPARVLVEPPDVPIPPWDQELRVEPVELSVPPLAVPPFVIYPLAAPVRLHPPARRLSRAGRAPWCRGETRVPVSRTAGALQWGAAHRAPRPRSS